ncbi:TonB-dependent receptor [Aliifodinibius sp. S!AR15-10]|uniref:SusC/RagA family TonB-linked outer membrane protein n=1 Tax=Aliifodinibius sp. S!AR15-10 TaxID=2950437 RepID=UPI0028618C5F|nr:TonB-dependent receptor [Aliifodinibius sp. S!AR15-10]MDR8391176.1 TonB-dependent receptor [Aliifodinibius sp. S!AR15-10]
MREKYNLYHLYNRLGRKCRTAFLFSIVWLLPLAIIPATAQAQADETITGVVVDGSSGETLPGVNILVKGTTIGTSSGANGNYELSVPSLNDTLVASFVGFQTQEIPINGRTTIDIRLQPQAISGEELVVIGYGSVQRRELTGSVSSVTPDDFNEGAVTDPMRLLQGKVSGLSVTTTNGGDPTAGFEVRLRGSSSLSASQEPLVVIDGIPGGDLNAINPNNIESIDILKDGSAAAIYGTRGTNGVILVTTKKGTPGETQVEYSAKFSTQRVSREIDVLSADQYRSMKEQLSSTRPDVAQSMTDYGASTDWFDEVTRKPFSQIHSLALSGGMENTTYRASLYYANQEGIMLNSAQEQYRANLNLQQSALDDRLQMDLRLGIADANSNPVNYDAIRQVIKRNPTEPVYNENGEFMEFIGAWQYENPVGMLVERENEDGNTNFSGDLSATLDLTDNIAVKAVAGLESNKWLNGYYEPSYSYPQESAGTNGSAERAAGRSNTRTFESTIEWQESVGAHSFNLLGGYSYQQFTDEGFDAENTNFITDGFSYNNLGSGTYLQEGRAGMGSFKEESQLVGYFGRGNYNFNQKYFLTASVRYEGSSKFGSENKWGVFPAVSAAWDISNENLGGLFDNFDLFKLRAGFGVTGNQGISPYIPLLRFEQSGFYFYEGQFVPGYQPASNPNPNLRWETKEELNVGLDWSLLSGRLGGTVEYYQRDTEDLLHSYDVPTPPNLYTTTFANVGSMRNSGVEFSLNTVPIQNSDWNWSVDFNVEYRKNELLTLSNDQYQLEYRNVGGIGSPGIEAWSHRYEPGRSIGSIHGYKYEGLTEDGEWIFADLNDDGAYTPDDRTYIGNGVPDFYTGLTSSVQYKNWDFSVMMRGMFGHQIINHKRIWYDNPKFLPNNILESAMDSELWDDPKFNSSQVEDGDFVKVDNITLGYTLPIENIASIKNGRLFFTVDNAFLITGYSGIDPEVSIGGLTPGLDSRQDYPSTRTFTLGFNLSF